MPSTRKNNVVSALRMRSGFGALLRQVEEENGSVVIEKRGRPKAVLISLRDYVRLAAPEPEILKILGRDAKRNGTSKLSSRQIDDVIRAARRQKRSS